MRGRATAMRGSKYHSIATVYKGHRYPSKAEARRASELDLLMRMGQVSWWLRQVPIDIGEPGVDRPYRVDFLVGVPWGDTGAVRIHAEDVKGVSTASFRRHLKQWKIRGPFPLHVLSIKGTEVIQGAINYEWNATATASPAD